ncbi:MAG: phosphoribosylformimino-5-aminoimidazole carboxamide ribotide isomerase [Verrucomicrobiota bacterium]|nr:phosphoribosylformimino-5-aminoimidazole carboxamide ribotide isomerase [Verrucomicrobiota bacterium]
MEIDSWPSILLFVFRPCIDLHKGQVKQIVGGTLSGDGEEPQTNFVSDRPSSWYAALYRKDDLRGGHVIQLGPGNDTAAREALAAFPGGLQLGGGIKQKNAAAWIDAGASHVIVTSWVFREGQLDEDRLAALVKSIGRERLVLDLSCRERDGQYWVVTDRWQNFTELPVNEATLKKLAPNCSEFLIHAVDVEGKQTGIDLALVQAIAAHSPIPVTYAGGAQSLADLEAVEEAGQGRVHLTIGSALDIFGGTVKYEDCVAFNQCRGRA